MKRIVTREDYVQSLKDLRSVVYYNGKRVEDVTGHPAMQPHINSAALTYELALRPENEDLMTAVSHLSGKKINRFTHIHQSVDDLIKKILMMRLIAHETGSCFQRCVGFDALNAAYMTAYDTDQKHSTDYFERFKKYLLHVQESNVMVVGGMTDPKGDRSLSPSRQADPDLFTHIVERRSDGIVIRGAKVHMTGGVNSHEILIMPTQAMKEADRDYAVACALPLNAPGVTLIFGRQTNEERKMEESLDAGNPRFGVVGGEAMIVFDNVFVPWERVFLCGEYDMTGLFVERFATLHRQNYGGCKGGVSDVLIGAAALAAEYQGTASAGHIKEKLAEMMHLAETIYCGSVACSAMGFKTPSGAYYPDPLLANTTKHNVSRHIYEISRLAHDIAGGIIATMPFARDLESSDVGDYVRKFLAGVKGVKTEDRMKILRLVENMSGGTALAESMHGAGSPQSQKVMYGRLGNLEQKKRWAKKIVNID
ncbi:MAG: 4-hydroxyphenylacetate 3-hydroxylase family protein [Smithellaceae bacterium]|nr:4-hydroxyphenylacetate 3-hydroxylase family protein [Smithellaceae bacterium]NLX51277.1 4-hydroxybutyryl-CoA dehydratase [Deltaproteobacteria bacterium]